MTLGNRFVINKSCIEPKATGVFFSKYQCLSPDEALPMTTHHPSPGFVPLGNLWHKDQPCSFHTSTPSPVAPLFLSAPFLFCCLVYQVH